jgi:CRP-like cAMP-binding protein
MSVLANVETFRRIPVFAACDPVHLQVLAFSATRVSFEAGEKMTREDQPADAAYLILSGEVALSSQREGQIGTAGEGALLGEVAMIGGRHYGLTATATEPVSALSIERDLFMRVATEFPEFAATVFRSLSTKLEQSIGEITATRAEFENARSFSRS